MGLVAHVFDDIKLATLRGHLGISHTRYSTTGSSTWRNAQPVFRATAEAEFALGHNGNLVNTEALAEGAGHAPGTVTSDTDLVAEMLAAGWRRPAPAATTRARRALTKGAAPPRGRLLLRADGRRPRHRRPRPNRFRPLCLEQARPRLGAGQRDPRLDVVGAHFVRARPRRDGDHRRHRLPLGAAVLP
ncbi:MAG: class II glutamine amidotransferase [Microthrixaceae bacterium]|nr:class II glutamine amidotransferase [Microthrixaceae bacterium]